MPVATVELNINGQPLRVPVNLLKNPKHFSWTVPGAPKENAAYPSLREVSRLHEEYAPCARRVKARCFHLHPTKRGSAPDTVEVLKTGVIVALNMYHGFDHTSYVESFFVPFGVLTPLCSSEQHTDPTLPQLVVLVVKGRGNSAPDVHWFPVAKYSLVNA